MKCVYAKDYVTEKNVTIAFRAEIASGDFTLKIAASNTYQVFVNGAFVAYGPMRSAHGYSNVSAYAINNGAQKSVVIVEVASYNIGTYYIVKEEPFFACEIVSAAGQTLGDTDSFKAYLVDDRDKKVMKYDLQRPFTESYRMSADRSAFYTGGGSFREVSVKTVAGNRLVDSELKLPAYERQVADKIIECGTVSKSKNNHFHDHEWFYKRNGFDAYTKDELDINLLEDA
ncbi:MAG: hypothetical protein LBH18_03300, partial [Spirochaetaceae bacterium]|nr:hypothetical protein [Spirochaetaceae bacterium]